MESLLPLIANVSLHWIWLGHQISASNPYTIHVLCLDTCANEALFQTFAVSATPWMLHYNADELSSDLQKVLKEKTYNGSTIPWTSLYNAIKLHQVQNGETVLILGDTPEETKRAITKIASVVDAFRLRYFLVQLRYVDEKVIEHLVSFAWAKYLNQVVVIRLADNAIYAVSPKYKEARVTKVPVVQWPNLNKIDMSSCILKIAVTNVPVFYQFDSENDSSFSGLYAPFYTYAKKALNFQAVLLATPYSNMTRKVISGEADMSFYGIMFTPDMPLELSTLISTPLIWCVPDSCVSETTSAILWREFSASSWAILIVFATAVILTVWLLSPANILDSFFMILSTMVSMSVKLPDGHVRWALAGWLLPMLVMSTAYQTVLHSLMAAPLIVHEVKDVNGLLQSQIPLICFSSSCPALFKQAKAGGLFAKLADRTKTFKTSTVDDFVSMHQETHGIYTPLITCYTQFPKKRPLLDTVQPIYVGLFAVLRASRLAPALRRLALQTEAAGLPSHWSRYNKLTRGCSISETRDVQPITIAILWPAFLLLCCGLPLGLIVFLTEVWWFWWKTKVTKEQLGAA